MNPKRPAKNNFFLINENASDEEVAVYVREKNKEAYGFLIDRYQQKIWRYINRLTNNSEESKDLTQRTFIRAYVNLHTFDRKKKFSSWIYRIAHNLTVNWLKKKKAKISIDQNEIVASRLTSRINVFESISQKESYSNILMIINKLPDKFKIPFILHYLEEKSYEEISDILRKPKNTVGTMINRAKKRLKKELEKNYGK